MHIETNVASTHRSIATDRLILAPHRPEDVEDCIYMWSDPRVVRLIRPEPFSAEETWARVLRYAGHWAFAGIGYWTIRCRETNLFFGELGFAYTRRILSDGYSGLPEFGCTLATRAHGQGIAFEATQAALRWMDNIARSTQTVAITDRSNHSAVKLAERAGYRNVGEMSFNSLPFTVFARQGCTSD